MYPHPARIYGDIIPGSEFIRSLVRQGTISKGAAKRLKWFDYYRGCGNARKTCRYFGISAQTFYRWKNRFDPYDLTTLEEESRRPHRVCCLRTSEDVVEKVRQLRQQYPRWGEEKLAVLLRRDWIRISGSTVGRVMRRKPRYAVRRPRDYRVQAPGDLVQMDTSRFVSCPMKSVSSLALGIWSRGSMACGLIRSRRAQPEPTFSIISARNFHFPSWPSRFITAQSLEITLKILVADEKYFFLSFCRIPLSSMRTWRGLIEPPAMNIIANGKEKGSPKYH